MGNLYAEENAIKAQYEELLSGSSQENNPSELSNKSNIDDPDGSREILIQRRKNYLDNLDKSFKRLDSELFSIDKLRAELTNARGEILVKKDEKTYFSHHRFAFNQRSSIKGLSFRFFSKMA